jgi:hypothetical protein
MDEGGYARHPCIYSPKTLRVRKGEDWAQIRSVATKESDDSVNLRKEATLTCGSMVSVKERERKARVR